MSYPCDGASVTHSFQKLPLVIPGVFPRKFDLDVQRPTVRTAMTMNVGLAMLTHTNDTAVLGIELTYRVVTSDAAVLTEGYDYLVL